MSKQELSKDKRVSKEKARLAKFYKNMDPSKKGISAGLIERAAFMRVECEDLEKDLLENGWVEKFQQSRDCEPYDRTRPQGQTYQALNGNYQKIIKQLDSLLPERPAVEDDDSFDEFVNSREDL